ncbi:hypothetical protein [Actinoplanes sp. NPDC026619]|uniref:hypothetical protein n=1 Tax=Actinoplanes sp. NPDC026619 TaxID=3155798 RepID=UPI0033DB466E
MVYHVRDVLESGRQTPPPPFTSTDDIIRRAGRIRLRRSLAAGGAAVAVALAAIGGGLLVGKGPGDNQILTAAPLPAQFRTVFGEYRTGPNQIGPIGQVTTEYQRLPVYRDGLTWDDDQGRSYPLTDGAITFYQPGVFDPAALGSEDFGTTFGPAFAVTVGGKQGIGKLMTYATPHSDRSTRTALAWQYEPGAWATYVPAARETSASTADAIRIADAVKPGASHEVKVPYRMTFVPDGWQTVAAEETTTKYSNVLSDVYLYDGPLPGPGPVDVRLDGVHLLLMRGLPKDGAVRGKDGVHCYPVPACTVVLGDYFIDVDARTSGLSPATVRQIVDGLKPVDFTDHSTWLPVGG